jgi:hypothetical protein
VGEIPDAKEEIHRQILGISSSENLKSFDALQVVSQTPPAKVRDNIGHFNSISHQSRKPKRILTIDTNNKNFNFTRKGSLVHMDKLHSATRRIKKANYFRQNSSSNKSKFQSASIYERETAKEQLTEGILCQYLEYVDPENLSYIVEVKLNKDEKSISMTRVKNLNEPRV